jgi:hypothetical protein
MFGVPSLRCFRRMLKRRPHYNISSDVTSRRIRTSFGEYQDVCAVGRAAMFLNFKCEDKNSMPA